MNISRQNIYLLALSVFLLIFVLIFSFSVLIPNGKEYRIKKNELIENHNEIQCYDQFSSMFQSETSGSTGQPFKFKKDVNLLFGYSLVLPTNSLESVQDIATNEAENGHYLWLMLNTKLKFSK